MVEAAAKEEEEEEEYEEEEEEELHHQGERGKGKKELKKTKSIEGMHRKIVDFL